MNQAISERRSLYRIQASNHRGQQRRLRRVEVPRFRFRCSIPNFIDRGPRSDGIDFIDLKRSTFNQRPDSRPARPVVRALQRSCLEHGRSNHGRRSQNQDVFDQTTCRRSGLIDWNWFSHRVVNAFEFKPVTRPQGVAALYTPCHSFCLHHLLRRNESRGFCRIRPIRSMPLNDVAGCLIIYNPEIS